jgi:hydrogenase-4 component F
MFLAAMSLALLADNLGVLWVAVEATTIATAFLVGHNRGRAALEAAWKYVVLGSVGVAVAFLGIVLLYAATVAAGQPTLSWLALTTTVDGLDPSLVRLAVALAALGFATKAGLAPMHSWLPDAHGQAPAPVSGLMSGVLLAVAFYAILRVQAIADVAIGPDLMRGLLVVGGLLSLLVAAALILAQRDYKRMLAYSSIEHMGLLALGAAVGGPLALAAVLLHVLGHGLAKASMFVVAGRILTAEGSTKVGDVRALLARRPGLAVPFLAGTAALLGFPPFSLFFSEVAILLAGWQAGLGWAMGIALALLLAAFAGLGRHALAMTMGDGEAVAPSSARSLGSSVPVALALGVTAVVGFAAVPMATLLTDAVAALGVVP